MLVLIRLAGLICLAYVSSTATVYPPKYLLIHTYYLGSLEFIEQDPAWNLEEKAVLFLYPTLRSLDTDYAYHERDLVNPPPEDSDTAEDYWRSAIFDADPGPRSTNLKTLQFYLSEINPSALMKILSFPRSLEHSTLTHLDHLDHLANRIRQESELVIEALRRQQHSLTSLVLQGIEVSSVGILIGTFDQLRALDIDFDMLFGGDCRYNNQTNIPPGPHLLSDINTYLPSSLESLNVRYRQTADSQRICWFAVFCTAKP